MAALTLAEASKIALNNGEMKKAGIISLYAEKSDLMAAIRWDGIMGNALSFTQEGDLPATAFRGINEGFTPSAGSFNPQTEALFAAGGDLDVDRFIVKTQGEETRTKHEALKVKSLAANITDTIITGDNASEPREFNGLQVRATGGQLIENGNTSGGDPLSLNKLDEAIDAVNDPTHLLMPRALKRRFISAQRSSTSGVGSNIQLSGEKVFGEEVAYYRGLPILTGYKRNKNTSILPYTEAGGGGGTSATSVYVLNLNEEDGLIGITNGGIDVRDLGELEEKPAYRTRVEWYIGLAMQSPYAIARLRGISDAAIAA